MRIKNEKSLIFFILITLILLNSCIGLSMDIQVRRNGSGKIDMEYRVSKMAEVIGRLDGNERWPIIPVGRADWERSIARIDGVKLASFSSRENAQDSVTKVTLDFDNIDALIKILGSTGTTSSSDSNTLNIIFNGNIPSEIDSDLLELFRQVSAGYNVAFGFTAVGSASTLIVTDGKGNEISAPARAKIVPSGRKVSLSMDTADILEFKDGLGVRVHW